MDIFAARLADIEKALMVKKHTNPVDKLPKYYHDYFDVFHSAYIDDILIFSNSLSVHEQPAKQVLKSLRDAGLRIDMDK